MTKTLRWHLTFLVIFLFFFNACAPQGSNLRSERSRVDGLVAQVHVGDDRAQVEKTFGRPYSTEGDGSDLVMTYVTGPKRAAAEAEASRRGSMNMGVLSSLLSTVGSYGGNSLGTASSVGSQALNMGNSLNSGGSATVSSEETVIKVRLRENKVMSVDRLDSGRVGIGAEN